MQPNPVYWRGTTQPVRGPHHTVALCPDDGKWEKAEHDEFRKIGLDVTALMFFSKGALRYA
jgi:hypothetical protein